MSSSTPKISIIVPIYNVGQYLANALDSLIGQTYSNLEIICINDGSSDNSAAVLSEYAAKDSRIVVINKTVNEGVATARSDAVDIAHGEYLMFVDGDDWVELDSCAILIDIMCRERPDVIMFSYYREYKHKTLKKYIYDQEKIVFDSEACKKLHRRHAGIIGAELREPQNADAICSLCTKMFRKDIFKEHHIKYIDNRIIGTYDDGLVNLNYYQYVKKAIYINRCLYHYRKYNESSVTTVYKRDFVKQWNNLYDIIQKYIDDNHCDSEYQEGLNNRIALGIIGLGMNELHGPKSTFEKIGVIKSILSEERYRAAIQRMPLKYMPLHWRVFFFLGKRRCAVGIFVMLSMIIQLKSRI